MTAENSTVHELKEGGNTTEFAPTHRFDVLSVVANHPLHFIVIGAGGTGGYLIPQLARQISVMNIGRAQDKLHQLTICDADDVESKNLIRQNFIARDIGKGKAEVMATRYATAFGIKIGVFGQYVESDADLNKLLELHPRNIPVIVGCVDNNKSRQLVARMFYRQEKRMFWIDSGNEEYAGQVVIGYNIRQNPYTDQQLQQYGATKPYAYYLPCATDCFPDIMNDTETKFVTELSCAERAISHPQSIATNMTAANVIFNFCNTLLNSGPGAILTNNVVTFNSKTNSFAQNRCTHDQITKRYQPPAEKKQAEPMAAG